MWQPLCSLPTHITSSEPVLVPCLHHLLAVCVHLRMPLAVAAIRHQSHDTHTSLICLCSLTRVGVMVLVCHESNDIFLEAAKVSLSGSSMCMVVIVVARFVSNG